MLRKRGLAGAAALALVLTLSVAPAAEAVDKGFNTTSVWTTIQAWAQDLLGDWLGWKAADATTTPESTYNESEDSQETVPPVLPLDIGPGGTSTNDEGDSPDPNG